MITTIRSSSLSKYPDCARRWAAQMLRAEVTDAGYTLTSPPKTIAAPVGTGVHGGAAHLLRCKMERGALIAADYTDACDVAIAELHNAIGEGDIFLDDMTPTRTIAELQVVKMLGAYAGQVVPFIDPLVVEERMEANCCWDKNGEPSLVLSGQGDNLCRSPNGLRDLKTGARAGGNHKPQLGSYSLLFRTAGFDVHECCIDFVQRVKIDKPQPPVLTTAYNVGACEVAARRIIDHISRDLTLFRDGDPDVFIQAGDPWAFSANPSSILCSAKWCSAYGTNFCTEHKEV